MYFGFNAETTIEIVICILIMYLVIEQLAQSYDAAALQILSQHYLQGFAVNH